MTNHEPTPVPKSTLKWVGVPVVIAILFMGILYIAVANEPDYMPAQQKKAAGIDVHAKHANASTQSTATSVDTSSQVTEATPSTEENITTENSHHGH